MDDLKDTSIIESIKELSGYQKICCWHVVM